MLRSTESDYVWYVWGGAWYRHQIPSDNPESNYVWRNINGESGNWSSSWFILDYANWNIPYVHEESVLFYDLLRNNGYLHGFNLDAETLIKRQKFLNEIALDEGIISNWSLPAYREVYELAYAQQVNAIDNYLRDSEHKKWAFATSLLSWLLADCYYLMGHFDNAHRQYEATFHDISYRLKSFELPGNILIPLTLCKQEAELVKETPNARGRWSRDIKREQEERADRWKYEQAALAKKNLEQANKPIQPQTSPVKPSPSPAPVRRGVPEPVGIWRSPFQPPYYGPFPNPMPSWKVPPGPLTFNGL